MKVIIEINMGNAAFDNNPTETLAELLRKTADKVQKEENMNHSILDENGNRVGFIARTLSAKI